MNEQFDGYAYAAPAWRRPAPQARRIVSILYGWRNPGWVFVASVLAATPFLIAAAFAPALLSTAPTVSMLAPIADARAAAAGQGALSGEGAPFYLVLLALADAVAGSPGRIHLVAKALAAALVAYPFAYLAAARLPTAAAALLTAGIAAFVAAPFSGPQNLALAFFLCLALAVLFAPADPGRDRALFEGAVAGGLLIAIWMLSPVLSLAAFLALGACPFLTGRNGLARYGAAIIAAAIVAGVVEANAPGINLARADAAAEALFQSPAAARLSGLGLAGLIGATAATIAAAAVFGGAGYARGWLGATIFTFAAVPAAFLAGADPTPIFPLAAALACLSTQSPFYDGVFRDHDRASIAVAGAAAATTLYWAAAVSVGAIGQFAQQIQAANAAPDAIRTELGLVQPGDAQVAQWISEGRFSTPEARADLALAPVDQSTVLLAAASYARRYVADGVGVAILTGADTACVIAERRSCRADGRAAARDASVVFVPRLDLDPASAAVKDRSEALLYTEFKLAERTPFWEVWVRRGVGLVAPGQTARQDNDDAAAADAPEPARQLTVDAGAPEI